jgi:hypothetical protein
VKRNNKVSIVKHSNAIFSLCTTVPSKGNRLNLLLIIWDALMALDFTYMLIYGMDLWVSSAKEISTITAVCTENQIFKNFGLGTGKQICYLRE